VSTLILPLRLGSNGSLVSAEQDSDADVESCVRCYLSYPTGWLDANPAFGRAQLVFKQGGVDVAGLTREVKEFEPRATPEIVASVLQEGVQRVSVDPGPQHG
jgi:hypothetical protein